ncbi:regulator of G protein signaling [Fomitiporia mediterranea MF3/22]|uniref:regulator of G protein signaling n=1 Tax=Fomitiporia mediterranea (strain MF3/22) TaxID=694068 RepID=UPI000440928C|nr:regulator of G protein signaling [Fomitiporia mediterranea MF3/22]EJD01290.1 regulator of G protein signaling [Fomitiporia mediterranea MF3/22]
MPEDTQQGGAPGASSSHMMKTTKRGRPFLKDTLDLFATLVVSLDLTTHKQFFKSFNNSFTTDEAAANLAALKFSQSNRGPDPRDPSRIVTTTTTTTFSMTRDMAKAMCQHFMDARLIENAADRSSNLFKERGVFVLTPKGLHVLERFISKNGISAEPLAKVFSSQPICLKLLHLERRSSDDEIIISQAVVTALFRRFAGRNANYMPESTVPLDPSQEYHERSKGIPLMDVSERQQGILGRSNVSVFKYCFQAVTALEWLCDFTSIVGRDEAAEMAAHFVRFGLIAIVSDKRKGNDSAIIFTVRGSAPAGNSSVSQQGEFRCTSKAIYRITDEGRRVARWDSPHGRRDSPNASTTNVSREERPSLDRREDSSRPADVTRRSVKESNTDRLRYILNEPAVRSLFRDFLRTNFCEENLSFWLEVEDFKRKFNTTSSARGGGDARVKATPGQAAMEKHHEGLIQMAFVIYNTYLAPSSQCELNIDHGLRGELVGYLSQVMTDITGKSFQGRVEPEQAAALNATQLQTMIRLYDRIQTHVFRLMATDSVPKFIKTSEFKALKAWVEDDGSTDDDSPEQGRANPVHPPGLESDEVGRVHVTKSEAANDHPRRQPNERQGGKQ